MAIAKARGNENLWHVWIDPAKAAIEAMFEPTEEMDKELYFEIDDTCYNIVEDYKRAIKAALKS